MFMKPTFSLCSFMPMAWMALLVPAAFAADPLLERMPQVFERAAVQYRHLLKQVENDPKLPRTLDADGKVRTVKPEDWTSGFFPGNLWLLYEYHRSPEWKEQAWAYTRRLEGIRHFKGNHDGGFMLGCSYGNALRLDPSEESRAVLRDAAAALGTRFVPQLGMIRSWDHKPYLCPVIIDNMMNLELLTWAARNGGDAELREIALSHADKTRLQHFRPDGSAYHVVDYDPKTGWVRAIHGCQGADVRTPWARGQAWALYGFAMMFRETGRPEYLAQAETVARFVMQHPNMPGDRVPNWDFGIAPGPEVPRDASAASVTASGLLELSQLAKDGAAYKDYAVKQLLSLSGAPYLAEPGANGGFLLAHSTGHLPAGSEIDVPLVYADYYFLEALLRYRAIAKGEKRPSFGEVR